MFGVKCYYTSRSYLIIEVVCIYWDKTERVEIDTQHKKAEQLDCSSRHVLILDTWRIRGSGVLFLRHLRGDHLRNHGWYPSSV